MSEAKMPRIALGAWAWGNDGTFGDHYTADSLRDVYETAMADGLNLWDTATVYGMGTSERILGEAGLEMSAVQNHYSLLNRSSETSGILDYCKENGMTFYAYMVLEQGALSGKYDSAHPFPGGSDRASAYNPILPKLDALLDGLQRVGASHDISAAQTAIAWAIGKGTLPIIGVTKAAQVEEAVKTAAVTLSDQEIRELEKLADEADVSTIRGWEKELE